MMMKKYQKRERNFRDTIFDYALIRPSKELPAQS